jgi:hypothetical protein
MVNLPRGTVTLLFLAIKGRSALWEQNGGAMAVEVKHQLALVDELAVRGPR